MGDKILRFNDIARNSSQAKYPHLWQGLVGAWCPSLGIQGSKLIDISGQGNHSEIDSGSPEWDVGPSMLFTAASDDRMNCGSSSLIDDMPESSIVLRLKCTKENQIFQTPICKFHEDLFGIYINPSGGYYYIRFKRDYVTTDAVAQSTNTYTLSDKYHIIVSTIDILKVPRLYVDGVEVVYGTQTTGDGDLISDAIRDVYIGNSVYKNREFDGNISSAMMYNRALTPSEIQLLYRTNSNALLQRRPSALYVPTAATGISLAGMYEDTIGRRMVG